MRVAALIVGIDGWEQYTQPLVKAISEYEPECEIVVIDNASHVPYPDLPYIQRTQRLCYSAAINRAAGRANGADWLVILSNDVACEGRFFHLLRKVPKGYIAGADLYQVRNRWSFLMGWCVCVPRNIWDALEGWDENFLVSSWEDVDFSVRALRAGFGLYVMKLPFRHLDQRQRFAMPEFAGTPEANERYFRTKHGVH